MPFYTIQSKATKEITEILCSWDQLQEQLKTNPDLELLPSKPNFIDSIRMGIHKTPDSWRQLLKNMKKNNRHSNIRDDI